MSFSMSLSLIVRVLVFAGSVGAASVTAQETKPSLREGEAGPDATLTKQIAKALAAPIVTIIDKPRPSPTGDPHDYVSYGRYYWPDPATPDGLPYIRKDGHPNRELIAQGDGKQFGALLNHVETLALGWTQARREDCALRGGAWVRAWFVTPATRLNPGFGYAQIRLGRDQNRGSASGLIETRGFIRLVEAIRRLQGSPGLTAADEAAIKTWFAEYLVWMTTSPNGQKEHAAKNNHGSWYLAQLIAIARFLDRDDEARALAREDFDRINWQIEPDGKQPLETIRTDGLSYSVFNLEAQLTIARLAAPLGIDLWNFTAPGGGSLKKALDYVRAYDAAPETWPHQQLEKKQPGFLKPLLEAAAQLDAEGKRTAGRD